MENRPYEIKLTSLELIEDLDALHNRCLHDAPELAHYIEKAIALMMGLNVQVSKKEATEVAPN